MDDPENMDDDDGDAGDSDLEAELAAITSDGGGRAKSSAKSEKKPTMVLPLGDLDKMVAESLRDIGSDEELSGDDDDPDLLNELSELTGDDGTQDLVTGSPVVDRTLLDNAVQPAQEMFLPTTAISQAELIRSRLEMYKAAEAEARASNDSAKLRRLGRGFKTLESLLKQVNAGKQINNDDIPPEVYVKHAEQQSGSGDAPVQPSPSSPLIPIAPQIPVPVSPPQPSPASTSPDSSSTPVSSSSTSAATVDDPKISALLARQREYKIAALTKKKEGDTATAIQYVKIIKMFDAVLAAARQGQAVDLSDMPPPPNELPATALSAISSPAAAPTEQAESQQGQEPPEAPKKAVEPPPPAPTSIMEALVQRLEKYKSVEKEAKDEGNTSKARRFGRIAKQYEDAIKLHKAGKSVPFDELPAPPGFGPIPGVATAPAAVPAAPAVPSPAARPAGGSNVSPTKPDAETSSPPARPPLKKQDSRIGGNHSNTSLMSKTIAILLERQHEFKQAALAAKKAGELEQAKEYLKTFKGIESLLNVARGGLPVDLTTVSSNI